MIPRSEPALLPDRIVVLAPDPPLRVLTATARGLIEGNFVRAAQRAFTELLATVGRAGQMGRVGTRLALMPDRPIGANDAACRYVAGVLFGHDLATGQGACEEPVPGRLGGSLAWQTLAPGRYAVFTHVGTYASLARAWNDAQTRWLPASGESPGTAPPLEVYVDLPEQVPQERLRTQIWLPLA